MTVTVPGRYLESAKNAGSASGKLMRGFDHVGVLIASNASLLVSDSDMSG